MSYPVTCETCGREVDDMDTVDMPAGRVCESCYDWLADMLERQS